MNSKDEEWVAGTLYGLTGMFTDTSSIDKEKEISQVDFMHQNKITWWTGGFSSLQPLSQEVVQM